MSLSPEQLAEIEQLREQRSSTLRAVSEGMEGHLYTAYPVSGSRICACDRLHGR